MRILFVVGPVERFELEGDTTYAFMLEAEGRGHECWTSDIGGLALEGAKAFAHARRTRVTLAATPGAAFDQEAAEYRSFDDFDAVFMRKDPPVDADFLQATWILEAGKSQTVVINDPRGLRELNEHLSILRFPELTPRTIVTRDKARLLQFLADCGGRIVVKPVDGHGGRGIFILRTGDSNLSSLIETATDHGSQWTMAQEYLPAAKGGDKRILLADGKSIGAVLRVPPDDEARGNLHVGGTAVKTSLTAREERIVGEIRPMLLEYGVLFAGIDVIGDTLTEINITSPTGVRHVDRLDGGNASAKVFECIEARVAAFR